MERWSRVGSRRHLTSDWQLSSMVAQYTPRKIADCGILIAFYLLLCVVSQAWADADRVLENVEYLAIDGKAAVRINFAGLITYKKHFPESQGNTLEIHIGLVDTAKRSAVDDFVATEVLLAPFSNEIPLVGVTYEGHDPTDPIVLLRFSRPVEYELVASQDRRTLLVKLPQIDFVEPATPTDSVKLASEELIVVDEGDSGGNGDEARRLFDQGKDFLAAKKYNDAIRAFTSVLNLPDHQLQKEATNLLAQTRRLAKEAPVKAPANEDTKQNQAINEPIATSTTEESEKPTGKPVASRPETVSSKGPDKNNGAAVSNYERQLAFGRLALERGEFRNAMRIFSIVLAAEDDHPFKDEARKLLAQAEENVSKSGSEKRAVTSQADRRAPSSDPSEADSARDETSGAQASSDLEKAAEVMNLARAAVERSDVATAQRLLEQVIAMPGHDFVEEAKQLQSEVQSMEPSATTSENGSLAANASTNEVEEDPATLMESGRAAMKRNDLDEATRIFTQVLNIPGNPYLQEAERLIRQATNATSSQADLRDPVVADPSTLDDVVRLVEQGRIALTEGNNNRAIVIFTKLTEIPEHPSSKESMEYLGVARQRNNQIAHAKSIFEQFLKKYPKGEDADRVKQRLADLISSQIKPKERLAAAPEPKKSQQFKTDTFGSWSQYYYFGVTSIDTIQEKQQDQSTLLSYLTANTRTRSDRFDIRAFFYGTHLADFRDDANKSPSSRARDNRIELSTLYVDVQDKKLGLQGRVGRQSSSTPGVLGRFDGALFGVDIVPKIRVSFIGGFPVDLNDKGSVNSDTQFFTTNVQFDDLIKNLDVIPYVSVQYSEGLLDRFAIGEEIRYFNPKGNFFNLLDYDASYGSLNILLFHGQFNFSKDHSINFNLDYRNNPLIFTRNAIIGNQRFSSLEEAVNLGISEDQLREEAILRTGKSAIFTLGVTNQFTEKVQWSNDITYTNQVYSDAIVNPELLPPDPTQPDPPIVPGQESEIEQVEDAISLNSRLTTMGIIGEREITIFSVGTTAATSYDDVNLGFQNRAPFGEGWAVDSRFRVDLRTDVNGQELRRFRPSLKLNYSWKRAFNVEAELGVEISKYGGTTNNQDTTRSFGSMGYRWNF